MAAMTFRLFSSRALYYGDALPAFHFLVLMWGHDCRARASPAKEKAAGRRRVGRPRGPRVNSLNAHLFAYENAVRYSVPVLIGAFIPLLMRVRFSGRGSLKNTQLSAPGP
jgi:hypothetical protein